MIFFFIVLIATTVGGIAGMGGGVIIKPALDSLGGDLAAIAVLSSVTVLTMCVVSILKQARMKFKIDRQLVVLACSALLGGAVGNQFFYAAMENWSDSIVNTAQIIISIILLLFALLKDFFGKTRFKNTAAFIAAGFLLGAVSTFVGIGGGPINVAVLVVFFGFDVKRAAVNSIFMIMFAQVINVTSMLISGEMLVVDLTPLWYMVPAAIVGGFLGALLNKNLHLKHINVIFSIAVSGVIALNVYNLAKLFV